LGPDREQDSAETITAAVVGDLHVGGDSERVQTMIRLVNGRDVDFVLFLGDLVNQASDESVGEFVRAVRRITKPVYLTIGNHDIGRKPEGYDIEGKIADALPGPWSESFTYSFQAGGWRFVVGGMGLLNIPYVGPQVNHYKGYVSEFGNMLNMPQPHLERFESLLAETNDRPTCVVLHVPLVRMAQRVHARGCYDQVRLLEEIQVLSLIEARANVKVALYGHQHFNQVDVIAGTLHCVTQGVGGYGPYGDPSGIRIMEFSPSGVRGHMVWEDDPPEPPAPVGTLEGDRSFEWGFS